MDAPFDVLTALVTGITAAVAAYAGAYLGQKARNRAVHEDLSTLLRATEELKAQVSGSLWLNQERWKLKAPVYQQLFVALNELANVVKLLADYLPALYGDKSAALPLPVDTRRLLIMTRRLRRLRAIASLWLTSVAGAALDLVTNTLSEVLGRATAPTKEEWLSIAEAIDVAAGMLLVAAREDLQLTPPPA